MGLCMSWLRGCSGVKGVGVGEAGKDGRLEL